MRCVELCFHERDARAADLAARGLTEAGLCVLRRPLSDARVMAPSGAAEARVLLHSPAVAALAADHPARAVFHQPMTVAPLDGPWPLRSSRPWLFVPPRLTQAGRPQIDDAGYWKVVAWTAAQAPADHTARIATQLAIFRALRANKPVTPVLRRRRPLSERLGVRQIEPIRGLRDWERAVTPLAVAGTLAAAAFVSALVVDVATRPEAWGAISQAPAPSDSTTNAFRR